MPDNEHPDGVLTPVELSHKYPQWGVAMQRRHREAGDFIPHIQIGNRIYYRLSTIETFLAERETTVQVLDSGKEAAIQNGGQEVA